MSAAPETMLPPAQDICGLIEPTGYKLLVYIPPHEDGVIKRPDEVREREETASQWAQVIALGPDAYKDEKRFPHGPWCAPGDFILMRSYSGTRFQRAGLAYKYRLINDDTVEAVIKGDPNQIERSA